MSTDAQVPFLTQEAYDRLVAELEHLSTVGRDEIAKRIEAAREEGAKVGEAPASRGIVEPGTVVTAIVAGGEEVFLLGSREIAAAGSDLDVYSEASPLGQAILGLKVGESSSYEAPNGRSISVEIVKVETYTG